MKVVAYSNSHEVGIMIKEFVVEQWRIDQGEGVSITMPSIVFDIMKHDFDPISEIMTLLAVSTDNKVVKKYMIVKGANNCVYATPKDIFTPLLLMGCSKFILCHNHPSGNVSPSKEDIVFTQKVVKSSKILGLTLLDHMIYTDSSYTSLKAMGML